MSYRAKFIKKTKHHPGKQGPIQQYDLSWQVTNDAIKVGSSCETTSDHHYYHDDIKVSILGGWVSFHISFCGTFFRV